MESFTPGLNHIEFWVSDLEKSLVYYDSLFSLIGWKKLSRTAYSSGSTEIYFVEKHGTARHDTIGPRHICFQAVSKETVDAVGQWLKDSNHTVIRGPVRRDDYSQGYYTVDFRDPDGYVLEVAYTPNMKL